MELLVKDEDFQSYLELQHGCAQLRFRAWLGRLLARVWHLALPLTLAWSFAFALARSVLTEFCLGRRWWRVGRRQDDGARYQERGGERQHEVGEQPARTAARRERPTNVVFAKLAWEMGLEVEPSEVTPNADIRLSPTERSLLQETVAEVFYGERQSQDVLSRIGFPLKQVPMWNRGPQDFWESIFVGLDAGIVPTPYRRLLEAAWRSYPANEVFDRLAREHGLVSP